MRTCIKTAPKMESFVDTPDGRGTVVEVNLLRQSVKSPHGRPPGDDRQL